MESLVKAIVGALFIGLIVIVILLFTYSLLTPLKISEKRLSKALSLEEEAQKPPPRKHKNLRMSAF